MYVYINLFMFIKQQQMLNIKSKCYRVNQLSTEREKILCIARWRNIFRWFDLKQLWQSQLYDVIKIFRSLQWQYQMTHDCDIKSFTFGFSDGHTTRVVVKVFIVIWVVPFFRKKTTRAMENFSVQFRMIYFANLGSMSNVSFFHCRSLPLFLCTWLWHICNKNQLTKQKTVEWDGMIDCEEENVYIFFANWVKSSVMCNINIILLCHKYALHYFSHISYAERADYTVCFFLLIPKGKFSLISRYFSRLSYFTLWVSVTLKW